nr:hypothetical protein P5658_14705 [Bacillus subtilis]
MINTSEKLKYWSKFFYDKEEYLEKSLKEVSNLEVGTIINLQKNDLTWKYQWEELLKGSVEDYFSTTPPVFSGFVERFLLLAIDLLEKQGTIRGLDSHILHTGKSFFKSLLPSLFQRIIDFSYKTLILELNVLSDQGLLQGETSEKRYQYFENLLHDKEYLRQLVPMNTLS